MLRFRNFQWALQPGESRFDAHLGPVGNKIQRPIWNLRLRYIAAGAEWRRCGILDRPHLFLDVDDFHLPPGNWRNLAAVDFWDPPSDSDDWPDDDENTPGDFQCTYKPSFRKGAVAEHWDCPDARWRVVQSEGSFFTIELSGDAESHGFSPPPPEELSALPGVTAGAAAALRPNQIYLLETVPFGQIFVQVPRNTAEPYTHAEEFARRSLAIPRADHMVVRDYIKHDCGNVRNDLHVSLHVHGYHDT